MSSPRPTPLRGGRVGQDLARRRCAATRSRVAQAAEQYRWALTGLAAEAPAALLLLAAAVTQIAAAALHHVLRRTPAAARVPASHPRGFGAG